MNEQRRRDEAWNHRPSSGPLPVSEPLDRVIVAISAVVVAVAFLGLTVHLVVAATKGLL